MLANTVISSVRTKLWSPGNGSKLASLLNQSGHKIAMSGNEQVLVIATLICRQTASLGRSGEIFMDVP
jgi:hypothetical protein